MMGLLKTDLVLPERSDLKSLSLTDIELDSVTHFDLFLEVGGMIVFYAGSPYTWTAEEVERLKEHSHDQLFYRKSDEKKLESYRRLVKIPAENKELDPAEQLLAINDAASNFNRVLYSQGLDEAALHKGQQISESIVRCVGEDTTCVQALGLLAHHDHYTYYHSARVAAYATAIALELSITDPYSLTQLALGCLLHDVGKIRIDLDILNKPDALTEQEWALIYQHPKMGVEIVDESILTAVPKEIILHHHERTDGSGYPDGLSANEQLIEVKIAAFADVFDALTTNKPYSRARSKFDALSFIKFNLLDGLHRDSFIAMAKLLEKDPSKA